MQASFLVAGAAPLTFPPPVVPMRFAYPARRRRPCLRCALHTLPHPHSPRQLARLAPLHLERPKVQAKLLKPGLALSESLLSSALRRES